MRASQARERQARTAAAAERALLQALLTQLPVAIGLFWGPELRIERANAQMATLWGRRPEQVLGRPLLEALPELQGQGFEVLLGQVLDTRVPVTGWEVPATMLRDGRLQTTFYNFVYQPLYGPAGEVLGVVDVDVEVTEQVHARQQVQELNEELATANEELSASNEELRTANTRLNHTNVDLDTFVYTASHDLKAPIANIEGLLDALHEQLPAPVRHDPEVAHLLHLMHGSVERFQRTLVHLTDVSKLQQAHAEAAEPLALDALAEAVRLDLASALEAAGGQLLVDVAACPVVRFSPKSLRSILYNLPSNAIKYRAPGRPPRVVLRATRTQGQVQLDVEDNGLGLDEKEQSKLFVMFRRLHTHVEGTGVGLYMVKRMVENAGGSIGVRSRPGEGSTFTVLLPGRFKPCRRPLRRPAAGRGLPSLAARCRAWPARFGPAPARCVNIATAFCVRLGYAQTNQRTAGRRRRDQ